MLPGVPHTLFEPFYAIDLIETIGFGMSIPNIVALPSTVSVTVVQTATNASVVCLGNI